MTRLTVSSLSRLSVIDAGLLLDAAERDVDEVASRGLDPDPRWIAARRRRIEQVRRELFGPPG